MEVFIILSNYLEMNRNKKIQISTFYDQFDIASENKKMQSKFGNRITLLPSLRLGWHMFRRQPSLNEHHHLQKTPDGRYWHYTNLREQYSEY
jgi:hypothetical protein